MDWLAQLGEAAGNRELLLTTLLLSLRIGAILMLTPVLHGAALPGPARVAIVLSLAFAFALAVPAGGTPITPGALLVAAGTEFALGATMALGVFIAFAAIGFAGRLIDVQIGFGMAQVFDPATQRQIPVLSAAFERLGVLVFFLANGHHALLRGIAYSIERLPPARAWSLETAAPMVFKQIAALFSLGFALAAPVVACLLLVELAMGVVARNLPQINMFVLGIPVKVVVGLAMLALWFAGMGDAMQRIYGVIFRAWESGFDAMAGAR